MLFLKICEHEEQSASLYISSTWQKVWLRWTPTANGKKTMQWQARPFFFKCNFNRADMSEMVRQSQFNLAKFKKKKLFLDDWEQDGDKYIVFSGQTVLEGHDAGFELAVERKNGTGMYRKKKHIRMRFSEICKVDKTFIFVWHLLCTL